MQALSSTPTPGALAMCRLPSRTAWHRAGTPGPVSGRSSSGSLQASGRKRSSPRTGSSPSTERSQSLPCRTARSEPSTSSTPISRAKAANSGEGASSRSGASRARRPGRAPGTSGPSNRSRRPPSPSRQWVGWICRRISGNAWAMRARNSGTRSRPRGSCRWSSTTVQPWAVRTTSKAAVHSQPSFGSAPTMGQIQAGLACRAPGGSRPWRITSPSP